MGGSRPLHKSQGSFACETMVAISIKMVVRFLENLDVRFPKMTQNLYCRHGQIKCILLHAAASAHLGCKRLLH
jgi:hypothetical protein